MNTDSKLDFDLSTLSLEQLIETYENINDFLELLKDSMIEVEEKAEDEDE